MPAAVIALIFFLIGLFKRIRETRFARYDTRFFTPLFLLLGAALLYLWMA